MQKIPTEMIELRRWTDFEIKEKVICIEPDESNEVIRDLIKTRK